MIRKQEIGQFIDDFASDKPTPGGGSAAALSGALAAVATCMVGSLTLGKEDYASVQEEMEELIEITKGLKDDYLDLVDQDIEVFNAYMSALQMSNKTSDEKEKRAKALEKAVKKATEVPFTMASKSIEVLEQALIAAKKGNKYAVSDAGVGAIEAWATLEAAELNVNINLATMKDKGYIAKKRADMKELKEKAQKLKEEVLEVTNQKIG
ncbi:cyclodeaminase/cyclohydrolase family protein [Natroniella sp. ANB-PHB2]|uniref:cyclodeaminase/cyclohydrolase family protein n=1 Tax=Natroniella sp. ANB-PHB2 TaxID=3384444 RepID=UPI0038D3C32F